jgi:hypothetical protein
MKSLSEKGLEDSLRRQRENKRKKKIEMNFLAHKLLASKAAMTEMRRL